MFFRKKLKINFMAISENFFIEMVGEKADVQNSTGIYIIQGDPFKMSHLTKFDE